MGSDAENETKALKERVNERKLVDTYNKETMKKPLSKDMLAVDYPDEKWVCMWDTWKRRYNMKIRASYTDPDNFGMVIFNDFAGYGLQEMIENVVSGS